jgi:hypothetical protein
VDAEAPSSRSAGVRERGYNLDYLLVGASGMVVPGVIRRRHGATEQDRQACRAVGRRIWTPIEAEAGAIRFALAYWDLMRLVFLVLLIASLVIFGIIDRTLLGGPIRVFIAVVGGATFLAAAQYIFTYFHSHGLVDTGECWVDRDGNRHYVRLRTPKPYDSLVSIGTGVFTAVMMLAQT